MNNVIRLANVQETKDFAASLAKRLSKPALIFLRGDLGAGKTTFAQGFIKALLNDDTHVQSPSYSYMNQYQHDIAIYHFDLYRIENDATIIELDLLTYIMDQSALRLVEWPERMGSFLATPDLTITIKKVGDARLLLLDENACLTYPNMGASSPST